MTAFHLASQSPRRLELLRQIGLEPTLLLPDEDEDAESLEAVLPDELPAAYVVRVTALKLDAAQRRLQRRGGVPAPVLAADTTVALGARILGKPHDADDAVQMLRSLSGSSHRVLTAVAVGADDARWSALSVSTVRFAPLSDADIAAYVASGEPFGKAGAYAIQGRAAAWVAHIEGSYSAIMGLPLYEAAGLLRQAGLQV